MARIKTIDYLKTITILSVLFYHIGCLKMATYYQVLIIFCYWLIKGYQNFGQLLKIA